MSARFLRPTRVLSFNERQRIDRDIASEKRKLAGEHEGIPNRFRQFMDERVREDPKRIRAHIQKMERIRSAGSPDSISRRERTGKERIVKEDVEWLRAHMVPKSHYYLHEGRADPREYQKVVQGCLQEHSKEFKQRAGRYKNTMRELDPDNPNAGNVEVIRPDN